MLILKLWVTGASMVAGQSTRGSEAAELTESVTEQVDLSSPPSGEEGAFVRSSPLAAVVGLTANDDVEIAATRQTDPGPPRKRAGPSSPSRTLRRRPPAFASRGCAPPIALRI